MKKRTDNHINGITTIPFELDHNYYIETWLNGNRKHFREELADLFLYNPALCMKVVCNLPADLQQVFINSEEFKQASVHLNRLTK